MKKLVIAVLAAALVALGGGVVSATTAPVEPVVPPEETVIARTQFDAALTANGIDPATARAVACTAEYSTAPFDPEQRYISSICFGLVGEVSPDPNAPQPVLYAANTVHDETGTVFTFFYKYGAFEQIGDPIPGEATAPISIPEVAG